MESDFNIELKEVIYLVIGSYIQARDTALLGVCVSSNSCI